VLRLIRRVAGKAGVPHVDQLSPHSIRHTTTTHALAAGAALHEVQDLMGHADPRTTRRYDRARRSLDRSPAHRLAEAMAAEIEHLEH
jgi:integrase/recombinase XerD